MRHWMIASAALLGALTTRDANAHPLFFERYLVCNLDDERATPAPARSPDTSTGDANFVLLPRRSPPKPLNAVPLVIADLVQPSPIGSGQKAPPISLVTTDGDTELTGQSLDYRCIGLPRGRAGILRVLSGSLQKRYRSELRTEDTIERYAIAAGTFNLTETLPAIRSKFERPIPEEFEPWMKLQRLHMKVTLAQSLADLADRASAPMVRDFLVERESRDFPGYWEDTLNSLARLDPELAQRYAVEALGRVADTKDLGTAEQNRTRHLLGLLRTPSKETLDVLKRLSAREDPHDEGRGHDSCLLMAARVRMGDNTLGSALASELSVDLRTNRSSNCYSELVEVVFPGEAASEIDTLLFRHRYQELLAFVIRFADDDSAVAKTTKQKLLDWLDKRLSEPEISGGKGDRRFNVDQRAIHLALMAKLGRKPQEKLLFELIRDPKDTSVGPWIAARAALDLGLADAEDAAVARLRLAIVNNTDRYSRDSWPKEGEIVITEHGEVVRRLAARKNYGFVLGLLDKQQFTRHLTTAELARTRPQGACKRVMSEASQAEEEAVRDAFWALTILGDECRPVFDEALDGAKTTEDVRGMSMEGRAMLRHEDDKKPGSALRKRLSTKAKGSEAAWERARDTLRSVE